MDYQEAIKEAETQINMYESMILYNKDFEPKNDNSNYERKLDFLKTAISVMQEMQQYKQLGTLEEIKLLKETHLTGVELAQISCTLKQFAEYEKIGTLEEVREAVEKQKKKKPIEDSHHGIRHTEVYRCPSCNGIFSGRGFAKYCFHCGQAIDWGKEEFQAPYIPNKCHGCFGAANNDCERCMDEK